MAGTPALDGQRDDEHREQGHRTAGTAALGIAAEQVNVGNVMRDEGPEGPAVMRRARSAAKAASVNVKFVRTDASGGADFSNSAFAWMTIPGFCRHPGQSSVVPVAPGR